MINRQNFFKSVRQSLFNGTLSQSQVLGMDMILNEYEKRNIKNARWLAYILATAYHETGYKMRPVLEKYSGSSAEKYFNNKYGIESNPKLAVRLGNVKQGDGFKYRGRGLVQITGRANYEKFGIADNPDLALDPKKAVEIIFDGMIKGLFTGKALMDYLIIGTDRPVYARQIINGMDKAQTIKGYYDKFLIALQ